MADPGVGPNSEEHRPVCLYTGLTPQGPLCGAPATVHLLVECPRGVTTLASCAVHQEVARAAGKLLDEHPHAGLCGLPATVWRYRPVSRCVLDDSGAEPVLAGRAGQPLVSAA